MVTNDAAMNWKQSRLLVLAIAAVAILLTFTSYQFFNDAANRVLEIASEEDRTSARILAHALANSLANKLDGVQQNVQIVAQAPSVQDKSVEEVKVFLVAAQQTSDDLTGSYGWLDKDGRTVLTSADENPGIVQPTGADISDTDWFIGARDSDKAHAISMVGSDETGRLFISHPITDSPVSGFEGVIYAEIPLAKINNFLTSQLYSGIEIETDLMDMEGTILSTMQPDLLGMNYFSEEYQATKATAEIQDSEELREFVRHALANPPSGAADFAYGGQMASVAYSYVPVEGNDFAIVFTRVPHVIATDVETFIDQQRFASILRIAVVGAVATFISILILSWNKKLEKTIADRTHALASKTDELLAANEQLKQNDRLQKEFINIAAHELRTPITPILTSIEGAEHIRDLEGNERIALTEEYYNMILRNAKRLERLSSDILQAARIESGTFRLSKEKFDLSKLVSNVVADTRKSRPESKKDIQIIYDPSHKGNLIIEADQMKLYQVITNLTQNALKFTTEGKIAIITERGDDGNVIVRVRDTGSGIAQDILPRLFQKFASASSSNTLGGTGLGLYISKSIVEAHDGRLWAENNKDGKGATFSFSIPLSKSATT